MKEDVIEVIQKTPQLKTRRCKLLVSILTVLLCCTPLFAFLLLFFFYNFFIGAALSVFLFIVTAIIRSKMRLLALPANQLEYTYSDHAVVSWYASKYLCFENLEKNENLPTV